MILDDLAQLWAAQESLSMSEIGDRLGISRSVIAGMIDRARRAGDPRFPARPRPVVAPIAPSVASEPTVVAPLPQPKNLLLVDMPWNGCRWPTGVALDGRHLFCGLPQAQRGPYCQRHHDAVSRVSSLLASSSFHAAPASGSTPAPRRSSSDLPQPRSAPRAGI